MPPTNPMANPTMASSLMGCCRRLCATVSIASPSTTASSSSSSLSFDSTRHLVLPLYHCRGFSQRRRTRDVHVPLRSASLATQLGSPVKTARFGVDTCDPVPTIKGLRITRTTPTTRRTSDFARRPARVATNTAAAAALDSHRTTASNCLTASWSHSRPSAACGDLSTEKLSGQMRGPAMARMISTAAVNNSHSGHRNDTARQIVSTISTPRSRLAALSAHFPSHNIARPLTTTSSSSTQPQQPPTSSAQSLQPRTHSRSSSSSSSSSTTAAMSNQAPHPALEPH